MSDDFLAPDQSLLGTWVDQLNERRDRAAITPNQELATWIELRSFIRVPTYSQPPPSAPDESETGGSGQDT